MRDVFTNAATMSVLCWRTSRPEMIAAIALILASAASWPLAAVAFRATTDAFIERDQAAATVSGLLVAVGAIGAPVLARFAYVLYAEASEMATVALDAELMEFVSYSARLEHHERADRADEIALLRAELPQFSEGMLGLMTGLSLGFSLATTRVVLAASSPLLLLVALAAVPRSSQVSTRSDVWTGEAG